MTKKFECGLRAYLVIVSCILLIMIFAAGSNVSSEYVFLFKAVYTSCFLMALFGLLNTMNTYYAVEEGGIRYKTLIRQVFLQWNDIQSLTKLDAGELVGTSVTVKTSVKKINITAYTRDYQELLRLVIRRVESNRGIEIDPQVYRIIQ